MSKTSLIYKSAVRCLGVLLICCAGSDFAGSAFAEEIKCRRVVALSPSVVETVDALGLQSNLVGVSAFTQFPESVRALPKVGGFLDPSIEAILALKPSVVIGLKESQELLSRLERLRIATIAVEHRSLAGILDSLRIVGDSCGRHENATNKIKELSEAVETIRRSRLREKMQRGLVLIGSKSEAVELVHLYASGRDGYYTDLLDILGVENIVKGGTTPFSSVSKEILIAHNPDIIFQIITDGDLSALERSAIESSWRSLGHFGATEEKKIFLLTRYVDTIPGPRFLETLQEMARLLKGLD